MKQLGIFRRLLITSAVVGLSVPVLTTAAYAGSPVTSTPAIPGNVLLTSGNKSLIVTWSESNSGAISFVATAKSAGKPSRTCSSKVHSCKIVSLKNGAIYDVTVVASTSAGSSAPSSDVTLIVGVPGAPNSLRTVTGKALVTVAWSPPVASGVTNITSYMATATPGGFSCSTSGTLITAPARTCEIAGLTSNTTYSVTVTATNAYGTGVPSQGSVVVPS